MSSKIFLKGLMMMKVGLKLQKSNLFKTLDSKAL